MVNIKKINEYFIERKVFRIFMDDEERAKILISYKLDKTIENKPKIIRDKVMFWLDSGNRSGGRYEGETPLVFVRQDLLKDLEVLDFANKLFIKINDTTNNIVKTERDIIRLYNDLKGSGKTDWRDYEIKYLKRGFGGDDDIHLKMPDYNYQAIKRNTFRETAKEIHINTINNKLGGK